MKKETMKMVCSKDPNRTELQNPWSRDDYTYATDGHILIRVNRNDEYPENPEAPNAEKIFKEHYNDSLDFVNMSFDVPEPKFINSTCICLQIAHDCPSCECDLGPEENCIVCHGKGTVKKVDTGYIFIHDIAFDAKFFKIIKQLPGLIFQKYPLANKPYFFKFFGGIGAVMPLAGFIDKDVAIPVWKVSHADCCEVN